MGKKINKFLGATNKTLPKASIKKLRRSRKPKELGKAKQGLHNKKKDKKNKRKTKQILDMTELIAKLKQDLPLTLFEISAIKEWLDEVPSLMFAERREMNQKLKKLDSEYNALILEFLSTV